MILLPRGNPVKEQINPGKINLPDALEKLRQGNFSGYLQFVFPQGNGLFLFRAGRFIDAVFESSRDQLLAVSAIARIFAEAVTGAGSLSVYRLSPELADRLQPLLHGELLYQGQELQLLNIHALLGRMRDEQRSGCLRVYSPQRTALIFYAAGKAVGFFHDGSAEMETTADSSRSVARDAGAKLDVLIAADRGGEHPPDLMAAADIGSLWRRALHERQGQSGTAAASHDASAAAGQYNAVLLVLQQTAQKYLGAFGASLTERELAKLGADACNPARLENFYGSLTQAAELVVEPEKIEQMLAEMRQGVKPLLVSH